MFSAQINPAITNKYGCSLLPSLTVSDQNKPQISKQSKTLYSQIWANDHLHCDHYFEVPISIFKGTSEQWPPVNNGHNFGIPIFVFVIRFDCILMLFV
jgi:hypothetical protein